MHWQLHSATIWSNSAEIYSAEIYSAEIYSAEIKYALRATLRRPYSLSEV